MLWLAPTLAPLSRGLADRWDGAGGIVSAGSHPRARWNSAAGPYLGRSRRHWFLPIDAKGAFVDNRRTTEAKEMKLYYHLLSAYSQKTLVAFNEKNVSFTPAIVDNESPAGRAEYLKINPLGKVPTLVLDDGAKLFESTIIIEYIDTNFSSGTRLIPEDKDAALKARWFDRFFDFYVNDPMQKIFFDGAKPEAERDPRGVAAAKATLDTAYVMADELLAGRTWALGDTFSLADCAAAPALNYARVVYPFDKYKNIVAYADRLAGRESFGRVLAELLPILKKLGVIP
jgi:glutathione S-transferase